MTRAPFPTLSTATPTGLANNFRSHDSDAADGEEEMDALCACVSADRAAATAVAVAAAKLDTLAAVQRPAATTLMIRFGATAAAAPPESAVHGIYTYIYALFSVVVVAAATQRRIRSERKRER